MLTLNRDSSALLLIDFQSRLMPAIADGAAIVANARRLLKAAQMFGVPVLITEENAAGLGATVPELAGGSAANCRRNSVTCSNTGLGSGPNEPVFRLMTFGSSSIAARAADQIS